MLQIDKLSVKKEKTTILSNLNLDVPEGVTHVIMGPNGSGKSTMAKVAMGIGDYEIKTGKINFLGKDITQDSPDKRAHLGIFLANQTPSEVPGVNIENFLRISYNATRTKGKKELSVVEFKKFLRPKLKILDLSEKFVQRNLNDNFSGGEKKKSEILQMLVLEPKLCILDETDSGLDIDSLKTIFAAVKNYKKDNPKSSLLIITHYERIFRYISADKVHVMKSGKIIRSGDKSLIKKIQEKGFKKLTD